MNKTLFLSNRRSQRSAASAVEVANREKAGRPQALLDLYDQKGFGLKLQLDHRLLYTKQLALNPFSFASNSCGTSCLTTVSKGNSYSSQISRSTIRTKLTRNSRKFDNSMRNKQVAKQIPADIMQLSVTNARTQQRVLQTARQECEARVRLASRLLYFLESPNDEY